MCKTASFSALKGHGVAGVRLQDSPYTLSKATFHPHDQQPLELTTLCKCHWGDLIWVTQWISVCKETCFIA